VPGASAAVENTAVPLRTDAAPRTVPLLVSVKATRPLLALTRALNVTQESYRLEVALDLRVVVVAAVVRAPVVAALATAGQARLPDTPGLTQLKV
jgi:hypothetical protein